jgi:hypothetical protein
VEIRLLKRVDREQPRLELTVQVLEEWDFNARQSLFCERVECDAELDLRRAVKPMPKVAADERKSSLEGFGSRSTRGVSDLEDLMKRFGWE